MTSDKKTSKSGDHLHPNIHMGPEAIWIFDLDNTLYDANTHVFKQIDLKMGGYISKLLNIPYDEARIIQKDYLRDYGTTLRGLMENHQIEPQTYLDFVHDVDLSSVEYDAQLSAAIGAIEGRKLIFTNGDVPHAKRILDRLQLAHEFEGIFDIAQADYIPKPQRASYDAFVQHFDLDPTRAVMVEDMARNLVPAKEMGMATVWLNGMCQWGKMDHSADHIDVEITSLPKWLSEIFQCKDA